MALTENDIFEHQLDIARTKAKTVDAAKKAELQSQIDHYDIERARIISANNAQRVALLQPKITRLEEIIGELSNPVALLRSVTKFRNKTNVLPPPVAIPATPPAATATPPAPTTTPQPNPVDMAPNPPTSPGLPSGFEGPHIVISDTDLDALARVSQSEVAIFGNFGKKQLVGGAAAVVDTILNRVAHSRAEFPDTIQAVIDKPAQFSAINAVGSWRNLPEAKPSFLKLIKAHLIARAAGHASAIRGAIHFLNPNTANSAAVNGWGRNVIDNPTARYGDIGGSFVHFHGFAPGYALPQAHAIEFKGSITWFDGAGIPLDVAEEGISGKRYTLPPDWKPDVTMDRIICHWTAGHHNASGLDKFHYHIMIEADGNVLRGKFSISDNVRNLVWKPRNYAAHTKGTNTRSIGVSVCCMANAKERPFNAGAFPMTEIQWNRMIEVIADLCRFYGVTPSPTTVLGHGEVQANLNKPQNGKWDPMALPWNQALSKKQVGELLRSEVKKLV